MLVDNMYETIRKIGEGGIAEVFLAEDTVKSRVVALKLARSGLRAGERDYLRNEYLTLSTISHPSIMKVYGFGSSGDGRYYMAMEHVPGIPFDHFFRTLHPTLHLAVIEILDALDYIHSRGMVHGDLKPSNVYVIPRDDDLHNSTRLEEGRVDPLEIRILDFGSVIAPDNRYGISPFGTIGYAAPELIGGENGDRRSDLFSLGVMLYEIATGKRAFQAESTVEIMRKVVTRNLPPLRERNPGIHPDFETFVSNLTAKEPFRRFFSAREASSELIKYLATQSISVPERYRLSSRDEQAALSSPAFIDRAQALSHLERAFREAKGGRAQVLFVSGEQGMGKTRLVRHFTTQLELDELDFRSYYFDCSTDSLPSRSSSPLPASGSETESATTGKEDKPSSGEQPHSKSHLMERATQGLLDHLDLSNLKSALAIVENLDSADDLTLSFWRYFTVTVKNLPILILFTGRDRSLAEEITKPGSLAGNPFTVELDPLDLEDTGLVIRSVIGPSPGITMLSEWIHEKSSGNPMFMIEILHALAKTLA